MIAVADRPDPAMTVAGDPRRRARGRCGWLRAVAEQTAARLDVAAPSWRRGDDPALVHHRTFCLLLAEIARRYPDHRATLTDVLARHAALDDLTGSRMTHLDTLLDAPDRACRWLGLPASTSMRALLDAPAGDGRQPGMRSRR